MDRSVPNAEVFKALQYLVTSVPGHFSLLLKVRTDQGPKKPRTEVDVIRVIDIAGFGENGEI